jgi:prepilin-type N-terminal cleavage/methylation domain-containing protein
MIRRTYPRASRRGLSLLEVVVALAIFLFSLTALSQLVSFAGDRANEVSIRSRAARLCQTKLAEVLAGVVPLSAQSDTPFDEAPDFTWSLTTDSGPATNLFLVTVTVSHAGLGGYTTQCSLYEMVLDPSVVGSTQDVPLLPLSSTNTGPGATPSTTGSTTGTGGM